jgi:hypothetical protein
MVQRALFVVVALVCAVSASAWAKPIDLEPYDAAGKLTVSLPKGWKITADPDSGVIAAQQDPSRTDAAAVLLVVQASASATEDQLLDLLSSSVSKDLKAGKRGSLPGGHGRTLLTDGTIDNIKVKIGAVAIVANGSAVVCLLASKTTDFDKLGGMELVTTILGSMKATGGTTAAAPAPDTQTYDKPTLDSYGHLVVPPLGRKITLADFAGEWRQDDSAITSYVSSSTGAYAGFSSVATTENWTMDAKGNVFSNFVGTTGGNGGAHQIVEKKTGTATLAPNMVLTLVWKTGTEKHYLVRGWVEFPEMTVMVLNGPWYKDGVPSDVLGDPKIGTNLNNKWVRIRARTKK